MFARCSSSLIVTGGDSAGNCCCHLAYPEYLQLHKGSSKNKAKKSLQIFDTGGCRLTQSLTLYWYRYRDNLMHSPFQFQKLVNIEVIVYLHQSIISKLFNLYYPGMSSGGSGDLQASRVSPADFRLMQEEMMIRQQQQVSQSSVNVLFCLE